MSAIQSPPACPHETHRMVGRCPYTRGVEVVQEVMMEVIRVAMARTSSRLHKERPLHPNRAGSARDRPTLWGLLPVPGRRLLRAPWENPQMMEVEEEEAVEYRCHVGEDVAEQHRKRGLDKLMSSTGGSPLPCHR